MLHRVAGIDSLALEKAELFVGFLLCLLEKFLKLTDNCKGMLDGTMKRTHERNLKAQGKKCTYYRHNSWVYARLFEA